MNKDATSNLALHCIDSGRVQLLNVLGAGAYGTIYRARDRCSPSSRPIFYAVKVIPLCNWDSQTSIYQRREVGLHLRVSAHPNILTVHRVLRDKRYLYIVLDYCPAGDMFRMVSRKHLFAGNDELIRSLFLQLIDAVHACHKRGIYHRDLKPENILVSEDLSRLYVADFGLSTRSRHSTTFGAGSTLYMSPECLNSDSQSTSYDTQRGDIWALGVILINMVTGRAPWKRAALDDKCYRLFLEDPDFLRKMIPISMTVNHILHAIFTSDPSNTIDLPSLRLLIEGVATFYMSEEEVASGTESVQSAWESYRFPICPPTSELSDDSEWTDSESSWNSLEDDSDDSDEHSNGIGSESLLNMEEGRSIGCHEETPLHDKEDSGPSGQAVKIHETSQFVNNSLHHSINPTKEAAYRPASSSPVGFDTSSSESDSDIPVTPETSPCDPANVEVPQFSKGGSIGASVSYPPVDLLGKTRRSMVGVQVLRRLVDRFLID